MGICPLSNEPCDNLKNECIYENINGEKTELNLCKSCSADYVHSIYFRKDYLELFEKNRELQQENDQQLKIKEIRFIKEDKPNIISSIKEKVSDAFSFLKKEEKISNALSFLFKKEKGIEATVDSIIDPESSAMSPEKMRNLYYKVKEDQKKDFENNDIQEADKKQKILNQIRSDMKMVKKMQKSLIEAALTNDKETVFMIEKDVSNLLSKYAELYNELFG
jgi:hypothetical protein